jgi:hypothetical protein
MDQVSAERAQRAAAQQQAAQLQQAQQAADVAATASKADLEGDNVVSRMMKTLGPAAGA